MQLGRPGKNLQIASRLLFKQGPPVSLIFFVTSKCNLLCTHCFYWEELNKKKDELTLDEIEKISHSLPNLLSVSLTGGEPYMRPDLPEIAFAFESNSSVRNIQIPSNGLSVSKTLENATRLLGKVQKARVATGVSLDGPEEIHNTIRQNPKSFGRALETLAELKKLKPHFPNLSVGVALTISAANQDCLTEFFDFVAQELLPDAITLTLVRGNPIDATLKEVNLATYQQFTKRAVEYRRANLLTQGWADRMVVAKEEATYELVAQAAQADHRIAPCYGGELIGVLSETGEVFPCESLDKKMGNVRDFDCDFAALWQAQTAHGVRKYQKDLGCQCTYECAMSTNTLFNWKSSARILGRTLTRG